MRFFKHTPPSYFRGFLSGFLIAALIVCSVQTTPAAVGDNLSSTFTRLASFLGIGKQSVVPSDSEFSTASLIEKVNYLEKKMDAQTLAIQNSTAAASAAYSLFVYLPKTSALSNYSDKQVKLISASGNQSATAILKDDGTNYSTTVYFNFSGDCKLSWTALNNTGDSFTVTEDVAITVTGQEFELGTGSYNLRLYLPKATAMNNYANKKVTFTSEDGSTSIVGTLKLLKSTEYSTTLFFDKPGKWTLSYDFLDYDGVATRIEHPCNITTTGGEQEIGLNSTNPKNMTWRTIHTILQSGQASLFGLNVGVELPDGWYIIATGTKDDTDALCIWGNPVDDTKRDLYDSGGVASNYYNTFNNNVGLGIAYSSGHPGFNSLNSAGTSVASNHRSQHGNQWFWLSDWSRVAGGTFNGETCYTYTYYLSIVSDTLSFHKGGCSNPDNLNYTYPCVWIN